MLCIRYPLSLRKVEDLLHERGIDITQEIARFWWNRFGTIFVAKRGGGPCTPQGAYLGDCRGRAGGARGDHRGCGRAHLCRCGAAEAVAGHRRLLAGGENFVTAETFIHAAEGFGRGEGPPVMAWVRLYAAQADAGIVLSTRGLRAFTQNRFGFAFLKQRLGEPMQNARSIAHYLISSGAEFRDGETMAAAMTASISRLFQAILIRIKLHRFECLYSTEINTSQNRDYQGRC